MVNFKNTYTIVLFVFIVFRVCMFSYLPLNFTDSDQCVLWQMAEDYSKLEFHSLFFYGQAYNIAVEAMLAVPLIWLKIPVYYAVPFITFLFATIPWIWMSQIGYKRGGLLQGILPLMFSLCFSVYFHQSTLISRGFVQGIFLVSLGLRFGGIWMIVAPVLGLLSNMNALFLLPIFIFRKDAFKELYSRKVQFYVGLSIAFFAYFFVQWSKLQTPDYFIHASPNTDYSWELLLKNIGNIHLFYNQIFFTCSGKIWVGVLVVFLFIFLFYPSKAIKKNLGLISFGILILSVFSLGMEKVLDGRENIFFGFGRFFLGIPFALGFLLAFSTPKKILITETSHFKGGVIAIVSLVLMGYNYLFLSYIRSEDFGKEKLTPVMIMGLKPMQVESNKLLNFCKQHQIEAVLMGYQFYIECESLGFKYFEPSLPFSTRIHFERRGWLKDSNSTYYQYNRVPKKVLLYDLYLDSNDIKRKFPESIQTTFGARSFVIPTGNQTIHQIVERVKKIKSYPKPQV